jgi:hypothetical protein
MVSSKAWKTAWYLGWLSNSSPKGSAQNPTYMQYQQVSSTLGTRPPRASLVLVELTPGSPNSWPSKPTGASLSLIWRCRSTWLRYTWPSALPYWVYFSRTKRWREASMSVLAHLRITFTKLRPMLCFLWTGNISSKDSTTIKTLISIRVTYSEGLALNWEAWQRMRATVAWSSLLSKVLWQLRSQWTKSTSNGMQAWMTPRRCSMLCNRL